MAQKSRRDIALSCDVLSVSNGQSLSLLLYKACLVCLITCVMVTRQTTSDLWPYCRQAVTNSDVQSPLINTLASSQQFPDVPSMHGLSLNTPVCQARAAFCCGSRSSRKGSICHRVKVFARLVDLNDKGRLKRKQTGLSWSNRLQSQTAPPYSFPFEK